MNRFSSNTNKLIIDAGKPVKIGEYTRMIFLADRIAEELEQIKSQKGKAICDLSKELLRRLETSRYRPVSRNKLN